MEEARDKEEKDEEINDGSVPPCPAPARVRVFPSSALSYSRLVGIPVL